MKTMEQDLLEKIAEKQTEIESLKEKNGTLKEEIRVTQEALDFLIMGGM